MGMCVSVMHYGEKRLMVRNLAAFFIKKVKKGCKSFKEISVSTVLYAQSVTQAHGYELSQIHSVVLYIEVKVR
jgi:hypothetical protein